MTSTLNSTHMGGPELLAPAGNLLCARAAVENGADAVYFGLEAGFNARARAENITLQQLPSLMSMLHQRGVKGYVTLNTLAFTDELPRLEQYVRELAKEGVDAVLVQDLGVARLVREVCPDIEIHASTQMTLTHADAIELVATELRLARVVLARELSIAEIRKIRQRTNLPLEAFVHGALCVAYSGQCLTSESLGGRSANRGQCAQACRLPYELVCDGVTKDLGDVRYLLSPQDLAAYPLVPQLVEAGLASLKIEGRLKTPEYVANVVQAYRAAIDYAVRGEAKVWSAEDKRQLELSFSRGFSPGWLEGNDHKRLTPGRSSTKRGVLVGKVVRLQRGRLVVELVQPLSKGDGIVLQGDRLNGQEVGGRVYEVWQNGRLLDEPATGRVELGMERGLLQDSDVFAGQEIWQTDDPRLTRRLRTTFSTNQILRRVPVQVRLRVATGQPFECDVECDGRIWRVPFDFEPVAATRHVATVEVAREQLGRLGNTVYELIDLQAEIIDQPMVPLSVWGSLRKHMIEVLNSRHHQRSRSIAEVSVLPRMLTAVVELSAASPNSAEPSGAVAWTPETKPKLTLLCRSLAQLEAALQVGCRNIIADFHDVREYRRAVELAKMQASCIRLATLRICKPGEEGLLKALARHGADGWLVRNLTAAKFARDHQIPFVADFSLNITNPLSAEWWKRIGAQRVTASYDLNRDQLFELARATPPSWLEVVIHQHMPMFHMEHCVFCSVLSPGTNKTNCGRPCDRHQVQLRDRVGALHVLHADIGCRNTLYNGTAQSGAEAVSALMQIGVRHFRIELLNDASTTEVPRLYELYQQLLEGKLPAAAVWKQLQADNRVGVTRGTLEQPRNPLAIL
ncbi:MAG: U32 family peptidase [Planctomycetaceae bacterium]|nr:U32 family peptidase [Planctomycetaceae bacterium]